MSSVCGFNAIAVAKPLTCLLGLRLWSLYTYTIVIYSTQQYTISVFDSVRFSGKPNTSHIGAGFHVFYDVRSSPNGDGYFYFFFHFHSHTHAHHSYCYSKTVYINEVNCENWECVVDSLFFQSTQNVAAYRIFDRDTNFVSHLIVDWPAKPCFYFESSLRFDKNDKFSENDVSTTQTFERRAEV